VQDQIGVFLASDGAIVIHPEPAQFFEVPISSPLPEELNFIRESRKPGVLLQGDPMRLAALLCRLILTSACAEPAWTCRGWRGFRQFHRRRVARAFGGREGGQ